MKPTRLAFLGRAARGLLVVIVAAALAAVPAAAQEVGPENGTLIVAGGALTDPAVFRQFVELAGGPSAPIVIIPTAGGRRELRPVLRGAAAVRTGGRAPHHGPSHLRPRSRRYRRLRGPAARSARRMVHRGTPVAAGRLVPRHEDARRRCGGSSTAAASSAGPRPGRPSRDRTWSAGTPAPTRS